MKPCPFCGGESALARGTRGDRNKQGRCNAIARVECLVCRAATDWLVGRNEEEAGRMASAYWERRG